jgi:hypothetical protein
MRGNAIHYEATGDYDIIDVCNHYNLNFNRGNVVKYIARAGKKDDELQDLYKAKDYIEREIAYVREQRNQEVKDFKDDFFCDMQGNKYTFKEFEEKIRQK